MHDGDAEATEKEGDDEDRKTRHDSVRLHRSEHANSLETIACRDPRNVLQARLRTTKKRNHEDEAGKPHPSVISCFRSFGFSW